MPQQQSILVYKQVHSYEVHHNLFFMSFDQENKAKLRSIWTLLIFSFPYFGIHGLNGLHEVNLKTLFYHVVAINLYKQQN